MTKQELLKEIKLWGEGGPPEDYRIGLCGNIGMYSDGKYRLEEGTRLIAEEVENA